MAGLVLPGVLALGSLTGCTDDLSLPDTPSAVAPDPAAAIDLLGDLTEALADEPGRAEGPWPSYVASNAEAARVADFSARYVSDDAGVTSRLPDGQWAAAADLTWRFDGYDTAVAHAEVTVVFEGEGDDLRLVSVGGGDRVQPLWLSGPVTVRADEHTLTLVAGDAEERAEDYAGRARRGLRTVRTTLPSVDSDQGVVVEVPEDARALEKGLTAGAGAYRAIAAITTTVDASDSPGSPVHVFVNAPLFGQLGNHGAQVVMTHEIVHLVTGAATDLSVPLWLAEGFADWVALTDSKVPIEVSASQVMRKVEKNGLPEHLPSADDFDSRSTHLGAAYEGAWLLVKVLGDRGGAEPLLELQERLADGEGLASALRETHGLSKAELVELWRTELLSLSK